MVVKRKSSKKKEIKQRVGSRAQVMHGTAKMTSGGLMKKHLKYNKRGKIVSKKASKTAKKLNRLVKLGYKTKKGKFGVVMKGGYSAINNQNELLHQDMQILSQSSIANKRGWDMEKSIEEWLYIETKDGRITEVDFSVAYNLGNERESPIGAEGAKGLKLPSGLKKLNLSGMNIGDEGAKGLDLPYGLEDLSLQYNNIGDEGAKVLFENLPNSINYVNIANNQLTIPSTHRIKNKYPSIDIYF